MSFIHLKCAGAITVVLAIAAALPAGAADLSPVEKLYADLAKLDPKARQERLIDGAMKEGGFAFINSLRGALGRGHIKIFQDRYPKLKIEMSELGSQDGFDRLVAESAAGRYLTDVAGGSVADMAETIRTNSAARYPSPARDLMYPRYRPYNDEEDRWLVWYWSEHGIAYNPDLLDPKDYPKGWMDLCNPAYKQQISFDPAETRFMTGLLKILGRENFVKFFECVGKNEPIVMRGHTVRMQLLIAGDHAIDADQYLYQGVLLKTQRAKESKKTPFEPVYTAEIIANAGANVINRNTTKPYTSALYADWCVTEENQAYMKAQYRGPIALSHPYMPDDVTLVPKKFDSPEEIKFVHETWTKHFGTKR
jgi:ABC-type Fe3+ transport system substrate-binding protein